MIFPVHCVESKGVQKAVSAVLWLQLAMCNLLWLHADLQQNFIENHTFVEANHE